MAGVRLRRTISLLCIAALVAMAPATAQAQDQAGTGGTAAPADTAAGGVTAGNEVPAPAKRKVAKRKVAKRKVVKRKARRRKSRRRRIVKPAPPPSVETGHHFPVAGLYDFGGKDSLFGARRSGHRHQGQDLAAAEGTPVVAPWAASVEFVRYQRNGAGWYVVLDGDGEDRDYVFMHLRRGSITVEPGQQLAAGQPFAQVGSTGSSSGAHLHFEIWVGGWYDGGQPIDPLPLLREWAGLLDA